MTNASTGDGVGQVRRRLEVGEPGRVARLEFVELPLAGDRLDDRERPGLCRPDHRHGQLAARDEALDEDAVVVGEGVHQRAGDVGRFGEECDLEGALLLLVSDAGRYIAGATIVVDGGQMVALRG